MASGAVLMRQLKLSSGGIPRLFYKGKVLAETKGNLSFYEQRPRPSLLTTGPYSV